MARAWNLWGFFAAPPLIQINARQTAVSYAGNMKTSLDRAATDVVSAAEWRRRAERARSIASTLVGDPAEQCLLQLAQEYDERAARIAAPGDGRRA